MRRRAHSAVLRGAGAGRAVSRRHGRLPGASTVDSVACEERDRNRDRYGRIVAVCRYGGQDVNAWAGPRGLGDGIPAVLHGVRGRGGGCESGTARSVARETCSSMGLGAGAIAWRPPPGTLLASLHVIAVAATSRATSATTAKGASTTCPAIATTNARASAPRAVSGISALKPKRGRAAGGERAGDLVSSDSDFARLASRPAGIRNRQDKHSRGVPQGMQAVHLRREPARRRRKRRRRQKTSCEPTAREANPKARCPPPRAGRRRCQAKRRHRARRRRTRLRR